jgi:hypothetical protein
LGVLRGRETLLGAVVPETTYPLVIKLIDRGMLEAIGAAREGPRPRVGGRCRPDDRTHDVDATLIGASYEKECAAGNYKGRFRLPPAALLPR